MYSIPLPLKLSSIVVIVGSIIGGCRVCVVVDVVVTSCWIYGIKSEYNRYQMMMKTIKKDGLSLNDGGGGVILCC